MSRAESPLPRARRRRVPLRAAISLLLLAAATAGAQEPAQDLRELARQARDSVVLLNVFGVV